MWRVAVAKGAVRSIERLPAAEQARVEEALAALGRNPFDPAHSKALKPGRDRHRWRVGEYRIFYTLDREAKVAVISDVLRRTSTTY
ncbi:MAG: type II toxin-antitoxin system RelE/ParE family toxin [Candidatus Odyssella sp.]|nr:type II toxin-antitoxin system RelE/ParE family toxin [Candidatus Odyssella sp.]